MNILVRAAGATAGRLAAAAAAGAGGFLAKAAGAPVAALVVLVVLKTAIDLRAHLAERRKLAADPVPIALA